MNYPLSEKIEELLEKKHQSKTWLAGQMDVNVRTIYNYKNIRDISLDGILKMSGILEYNFLADYNKWLVKNEQPAAAAWNDAEIIYKKESKRPITMSLSLRGDQKDMGKHMDAVLNTLRKECENYGLEIV